MFDDFRAHLQKSESQIDYFVIVAPGSGSMRVEGVDAIERVIETAQAVLDEGAPSVAIRVHGPKGQYLYQRTFRGRPVERSSERLADHASAPERAAPEAPSSPLDLVTRTPPPSPDTYLADQALGMVRDHGQAIAHAYDRLNHSVADAYGRLFEKTFEFVDRLLDGNRQLHEDYREASASMRGWVEVALASKIDAVEAQVEAIQAQPTGDAVERAMERGLGLIERAVTTDVPEDVVELARDERVRGLLQHPKLKQFLQDETMITNLRAMLDGAA